MHLLTVSLKDIPKLKTYFIEREKNPLSSNKAGCVEEKKKKSWIEC